MGSLSRGSLSKGVSVHWCLCLGVSVQGVSVGEVSVHGVSVQGGLCAGGSLSIGVSVQGVSVWGSLSGGLCLGGLCPWGLCPGGLCPGGSVHGGLCPLVSLSRGSPSRGVSVRDTPLPSLCEQTDTCEFITTTNQHPLPSLKLLKKTTIPFASNLNLE